MFITVAVVVRSRTMTSWYSVQKIDSNADSATKSESAFDLEDMPTQLKCPICFGVPPSEIYQCVNGHIVCKPCFNSQSGRCSQCRVAMILGRSVHRNRAMEDFLDQVLIACPYRKNGCLETFIRQFNMTNHVNDCVKDGNCVQLCHHLGFNRKCDYWTRTTKPLESVEHLISSHQATSGDRPMGKMVIPKIPLMPRLRNFQIEAPKPVAFGVPAHYKVFGGHFLIVCFLNRNDESISFVGIRIDKPEQGQAENEVKFRIESQSPTVQAIKWRVPVVSVLELGEMLQQPAIRVSLNVLKKHYLQQDGSFEVEVTVKQKKERSSESCAKKRRLYEDSSDESVITVHNSDSEVEQTCSDSSE